MAEVVEEEGAEELGFAPVFAAEAYASDYAAGCRLVLCSDAFVVDAAGADGPFEASYCCHCCSCHC